MCRFLALTELMNGVLIIRFRLKIIHKLYFGKFIAKAVVSFVKDVSEKK